MFMYLESKYWSFEEQSWWCAGWAAPPAAWPVPEGPHRNVASDSLIDASCVKVYEERVCLAGIVIGRQVDVEIATLAEDL